MAKNLSSHDSPPGWELCKLPDFTHIEMGQSPPSTTYNHDGTGLPFFQGKAEFGALYPRIDKYCSEPKKIAKAGATLLSVRAPVGPTNLAKVDCCIGRGLAGIHPLGQIEPNFVLLQMRSVEPQIAGEGTGSTFKAINKDFLYSLEVGLPPLAEQRRIIAKIEELFSELDKGIENLQTAKKQLEVYRQAVLKHAFEGKLTAQWRERNRGTLESADQLLARIKSEREAKYKKQTEEWRTAVREWESSGKKGKKPTKPKKLATLTNVSAIDLDRFSDLPESWTYIRLGLLIDEPKYGTSKKCTYDEQGIGVLRIPNIAAGVIDATDLKYAKFDDAESRTYQLQAGDVLTIRSNGSISLVGKCALVSEHDEHFLYAGYLIRLRPNSSLVNSEFLVSVLSGHFLRSQIEGKAKSTSGVNNINSGEIQNLIVPVCGVLEQRELVGILSQTLSSIAATEIEVEKQILLSQSLRQAILKRAFSGQLVEQDPNDESASVLLERIRAEKAEIDEAKKAGKTKSKKKFKRKVKKKAAKRKDAA